MRDGQFVDIEDDFPEIELVNPYFFWKDEKCCIERTKHPLWEYRQLCDEGIYDYVPELMEGAADFRDTQEDYEDSKRKQEIDEPVPDEPQIIMDHYWGNLYDTTGNLLQKNITYTIANENYVIRKPMKNPFFHRKNPYVVAGILDVPFSNYHKSLVGMAMGTVDALIELLNLIIDSMSLSTLQQYEMNMDNLYDPKQLETGIIPAKVWKMKQAGGLITQIAQPGVPSGVWNLYQGLDKESMFSGIGEMMTGAPRLKGRVSALEASLKSGESSMLFEYFITDLEKTFVESFLEKFFLTMLQYQRDWSNPKFIRSVPEAYQLANMTPEQRYEFLGTDTSFVVHGLSYVLGRAQELEKIGMFAKILGQNPRWQMRIKDDAVLGKFMESFNWEADEMLDREGDPELLRRMAQMQVGGMSPTSRAGGSAQQPQEQQGPPTDQVPPQIAQILQRVAGGQIQQ
jgi:hypothetical protein